MGLLCDCYVIAMWLLWRGFLVDIWLLCGCYVVAMERLFSCYLVALWFVGGCYVVVYIYIIIINVTQSKMSQNQQGLY